MAGWCWFPFVAVSIKETMLWNMWLTFQNAMAEIYEVVQKRSCKALMSESLWQYTQSGGCENDFSELLPQRKEDWGCMCGTKIRVRVKGWPFPVVVSWVSRTRRQSSSWLLLEKPPQHVDLQVGEWFNNSIVFFPPSTVAVTWLFFLFNMSLNSIVWVFVSRNFEEHSKFLWNPWPRIAPLGIGKKKSLMC